MIQSFLKRFLAPSSVGEILEKSFWSFSEASKEITGDPSHVLWAKAQFDSSVVSGECSADEAINFLKNRRAVGNYIKDAKQSYDRNQRAEIKDAISEVNNNVLILHEWNKELKAQNEVLKNQNERLRLENAEAGKKATRLSLGLFALSVLITLVPIGCKGSGPALERPQNPVKQSDQKIEKPRINTRNFYFASSTASDKKQDRAQRPGFNRVLAVLPKREKASASL